MEKKGDVDPIVLKVELTQGWVGDQRYVEQKLRNELRLKTNLGYELEFHPSGSLPRYEVKARRFKDMRKKG